MYGAEHCHRRDEWLRRREKFNSLEESCNLSLTKSLSAACDTQRPVRIPAVVLDFRDHTELLRFAGLIVLVMKAVTKPPLLQESRLSGGGSPNLVDLVERKVPVERKRGAANSFYSFHP